VLPQLGWREGQAIGRRQKRRLAKQAGTTPSSASSSSSGLVVPAGVDLSLLPSQAFVDEGIGKSGSNVGDDDSSQDVSFAPRSTDCSSSRVTRPTPKTDTFGMGYDPAASMVSARGGAGDVLALRMSRERHRGSGSLLTAGAYHTSDLLGNAAASANRRGMGSDKDQGGFAIFDDEDDVYDDPAPPSSLVNSEVDNRGDLGGRQAAQFHSVENNMFRIEAAGTGARSGGGAAGLDSGTGRGSTLYLQDVGQQTSGERLDDDDGVLPPQRCSTDNKHPLAGFRVRTAATLDSTRFPLPVVPPGFKEVHVFPTMKEVEEQAAVLLTRKAHPTTGAAATAATSSPSSDMLVGSGAVYDMLDSRGKEQYNRALRQRAGVPLNQPAGSEESSGQGKREILSKLQQQERQDEALRQKQLKQTAFSQGLGDALKNRFTPSSSGASGSENAEKAAHGLSSTFQPASSGGEHHTKAGALSSGNNENGVRALPSSGNRTTSAWQPARLLCKRMNVPVPAAAGAGAHQDQGGSGGEMKLADHGKAGNSVPRREAELYNAHVGKYITGTADSSGSSSNSECRSGMISVISRVTGDFEWVPKEAFLAAAKVDTDTPSLAASKVPPQTALSPSRHEDVEAGGQRMDESTTDSLDSTPSANLGEIQKDPVSTVAPAVIPQLSLFQSIFCPDSDNDSDSESESGSDNDVKKKGDKEGNEEVEEQGTMLKAGHAEEQHQEDLGQQQQAGELPSPGKVVFRKPEKRGQRAGLGGAGDVGKTSVPVSAGQRGRKRRVDMAVLSFQDGESDEDSEAAGGVSGDHRGSLVKRERGSAKRTRRSDLGPEATRSPEAAASSSMPESRPEYEQGAAPTLAAAHLIRQVQQSLSQESGKRGRRGGGASSGDDSDFDGGSSDDGGGSGGDRRGYRGVHKAKKHSSHSHSRHHKKKKKKDSHHHKKKKKDSHRSR